MILRQPIKTPRLILRDVVEEDLSTIISWLNDKVLMRYSANRFQHHTAETQRRYLDSFNGTPNYYLAALDDDNTRLVGTTTLYVDEREKTGDLGILVGIAGHRYSEEIYRYLIEFAFAKLGLRKVTAGTYAIHRGHRLMLEDLGLILEGVQVDQRLLDDIPVDMVLYGLTSGRWRELSESYQWRYKLKPLNDYKV
jgi:RimJ/RimL family protein N-acetyltransferase